MIKDLQERYGHDIISKASNLYHYCFYDFHSYKIYKLKEMANDLSENVGKIPEVNQREEMTKKLKEMTHYPFLKGGAREYAMIYIYLLAKMLRAKQSTFWDDAIFIIYFTYYTGFCYDSLNDEDFNYDTLYLVDKYDKGMAKKEFKEAFKFVSRYNFKIKNAVNNEKVKRQLVEKYKSFKKKYKKSAKVEAFVKHSEKIIRNGL